MRKGSEQTLNQKAGRPSLLPSLVILISALCCGYQGLAVDAEFIWDPNSEADLAGYKLYYAMEGVTETNVITLGTVTNATVMDLDPGQTYNFFLTALNTAGLESGPSDTVTLTMPETMGFALSALRMTSEGLEFSWDAVEGQSYQILYKDDLNDPTWTELITVTAGADPQVFRDYSTEPDGTPSYRVNARRFYRIVALP